MEQKLYYDILWRAKEDTLRKLSYIKELLNNAEDINAKDRYNAWYEDNMQLLYEIDKEMKIISK